MNPKSPKYRFKKSWSWPLEIENKILAILNKEPGQTLHVCCGDSQIGNVRIDLSKKADIKASMFNLPIRPASFEKLLCDPPWELPYHKRGRLLRQLRDCLKPNGLLVFNCFWFPKTRGLAVDEQIWVGVPHNLWRNASLLITARREALC